MNTRHLHYKQFEQLTESTSLILENSIFSLPISTQNANFSAKTGHSYTSVKEVVGQFMLNNTESLKGIVKTSGNLTDCFSKELTPEMEEQLSELCTSVFPKDKFDKFYTPYIALATGTNTIPPQINANGEIIYNPDGSLTFAEFIDSLSAFVSGMNSEKRRLSLDKLSTKEDYFNAGYNACVNRYSNPLFNTYTRAEFKKPITRLEMAYIIVLCWDKYRSFFTSKHDLGISFDWSAPKDILSKYEDGMKYKIRKTVIDVVSDVVSLDIRDYLDGNSVTDYLNNVQAGTEPIALPMFMSLVELFEAGIFTSSDGCLHPMYQVNRAEWAYTISKLAQYNRQCK